jgi:hypothetical protein
MNHIKIREYNTYKFNGISLILSNAYETNKKDNEKQMSPSIYD